MFLWNFESFQIFNFEINFPKNENLFQKTGILFLFENTKIENATFPYKTVLSEANVKTNKISKKWRVKNRSKKYIYHKERNLASNYFYFFTLFSYKKLMWCTNYSNVHIHTSCKHWNIIWGCFSPTSNFSFSKVNQVNFRELNFTNIQIIRSSTNLSFLKMPDIREIHQKFNICFC